MRRSRQGSRASGSFDPKHPPFFVLHSDGDNHGGGADSYYHNNTSQLVQWLGEDSRFELTSIEDYMERFPPDPAEAIHIEPGSWSGAGGEKRMPMDNHGPYPSQTGAAITADYCTAALPVGAGDIRYSIEAEDARGNVARTSLERVYMA